MTREKIKEGIAQTVCLWHIGKPLMWEMGEDSMTWEGPPKKDYYEAADMIMKGEHSQGVVIRGTNLPSHPHLANYFTVKSLIEEPSGNKDKE